MPTNVVQAACPSSLRDLVFVTRIALPTPKLNEFWTRLNLRETFTQGQLFPFRVEFDSPEQVGAFQDGELNIHHGPFLSAHGAIDGLTSTHRGLCYHYGAYVLSYRLVRLVRLDFRRQADGIEVRLQAYVAPWFAPLWLSGNAVFWRIFRVAMAL